MKLQLRKLVWLMMILPVGFLMVSDYWYRSIEYLEVDNAIQYNKVQCKDIRFFSLLIRTGSYINQYLAAYIDFQ
jgi:hypothetical protein